MVTGKRIIIVLIIFSVLFYPAAGSAGEARLTDIIVTNTRDDLLIYLAVDGAFRPKMTEAVLSGVPTTFSFIISLHKIRSLWFDKKIADLTVTHAIKFDRLKNEFTISRSWEKTPTVVTSFDDAKKLMTHVDSLKVIPLNKLVKGQQYQIRTKAELNKLKLPLYLHYVLFFISLWDFETDWYTMDFIY